MRLARADIEKAGVDPADDALAAVGILIKLRLLGQWRQAPALLARLRPRVAVAVARNNFDVGVFRVDLHDERFGRDGVCARLERTLRNARGDRIGRV